LTFFVITSILKTLSFFKRYPMNVSLTPELDAFVHNKVESGLYGSASEVLRAALRLLREQDAVQQARLEEIRVHVRSGFEDLKQGKFSEYASADDMADSLKAEFRTRHVTETQKAKSV
jgi:antitoxin ParD1/3/4